MNISLERRLPIKVPALGSQKHQVIEKDLASIGESVFHRSKRADMPMGRFKSDSAFAKPGFQR